uniref:G-protein coupled receptors family 1 profile domain-containing protein n=1 Tax=Seriola dumerili TaxID=41447 RepID=A0A3B4U765_SERDU
MAANNSLTGDDLLLLTVQFVVVQSLVMIFLFINLLLIITFFKKEYFYTTARYILFAVTLLSDSLLLFMADILLIFNHFRITIQVWLCIIISVLILVYVTVTPVTLAAMTLERYVAICMPLRHGELSSTRNTMNCILIIHGISSVPCILILSTFFASASLSFYTKYQICVAELLIIIIVFSYIKIMKVARAASGDDKKSSKKGLRTVVLHGFQLLLCLIQLWCPFIESAFFHINLSLYEIMRYLDFLLFYLAPRCLSPLIYGLRDEVFFQALKYIASFGFPTCFFCHLKYQKTLYWTIHTLAEKKCKIN